MLPGAPAREGSGLGEDGLVLRLLQGCLAARTQRRTKHQAPEALAGSLAHAERLLGAQRLPHCVASPSALTPRRGVCTAGRPAPACPAAAARLDKHP